MLLALVVVRLALVQGHVGETIWPNHPAVMLESGLVQVGDAAASGRPVDKALIDRLLSVSSKAPLAPEPFLVRGVEAQMAGNDSLALRAFLAARQRNPRAIAPHYFLADLYLKTGQTRSGLTEISALARLVPQSLPQIAPFLAAYARTPSAAPQIKAMLRAHPQLELALLNELSADPANARLVLSLWGGRGGEEAKLWQKRLLNELVETGRFGEARTAWSRFTGISAEQDRLFDAGFMTQALPPFGWALASGSSGIAEPQGGGALHALYYGRDDLVLASQILTLPPGRYRLSMVVKPVSPTSKSLSWTVHCMAAPNPIAFVPLDRSGPVSVSFAVPSDGCPAQQLELGGNAPEFPEQSEVTVSKLQLLPEGGR